jgi:hypothetical protein
MNKAKTLLLHTFFLMSQPIFSSNLQIVEKPFAHDAITGNAIYFPDDLATHILMPDDLKNGLESLGSLDQLDAALYQLHPLLLVSPRWNQIINPIAAPYNCNHHWPKLRNHFVNYLRIPEITFALWLQKKTNKADFSDMIFRICRLDVVSSHYFIAEMTQEESPFIPILCTIWDSKAIRCLLFEKFSRYYWWKAITNCILKHCEPKLKDTITKQYTKDLGNYVPDHNSASLLLKFQKKHPINPLTPLATKGRMECLRQKMIQSFAHCASKVNNQNNAFIPACTKDYAVFIQANATDLPSAFSCIHIEKYEQFIDLYIASGYPINAYIHSRGRDSDCYYNILDLIFKKYYNHKKGGFELLIPAFKKYFSYGGIMLSRWSEYYPDNALLNFFLSRDKNFVSLYLKQIEASKYFSLSDLDRLVVCVKALYPEDQESLNNIEVVFYRRTRNGIEGSM